MDDISTDSRGLLGLVLARLVGDSLVANKYDKNGGTRMSQFGRFSVMLTNEFRSNWNDIDVDRYGIVHHRVLLQ